MIVPPRPLKKHLKSKDDKTVNQTSPKEASKQTQKESLCALDEAVMEPPDPSAYQGHKSSAEAEMYCESAAWGTAARALRHPPTLPESAVSVATSTEEGGGRCALKVEGDKQLRPAGWGGGWEGSDRWTAGYIEGWAIKG